MKKFLFTLLISIAPLVAMAQSQEEIIREIDKISSSISSLECDFVQTKHLSMLNDKMVSRGKMYYSQPSMLRWEYITPYDYVFLLNANQVLLKNSQREDVIDVDKNKIVVVGESQGGLVAALAAANIKNRIDKLILIFPALCIPDNWEQRYPLVSDIPERTELWGVGLSREFFLELRTLDVFGDIGKYKGPVQIIQGDADNIVSMKDSERAIKLYKSANLHVIKGAGHGFNPEQQKESLSVIKQFMTK